MRPLRQSLVMLAVVLFGAACGGSGPAATRSSAPFSRPSSTARLTIIRPANGQVIHAQSVHVKLRLTGASAGRPATTQAPLGYLHLYLDSKIVSIEVVSSNEDVTEQTIGRVKPGRHMLRVEFLGPDHLPFRRRVIAAVTFAVRG